MKFKFYRIMKRWKMISGEMSLRWKFFHKHRYIFYFTLLVKLSIWKVGLTIVHGRLYKESQNWETHLVCAAFRCDNMKFLVILITVAFLGVVCARSIPSEENSPCEFKDFSLPIEFCVFCAINKNVCTTEFYPVFPS